MLFAQHSDLDKLIDGLGSAGSLTGGLTESLAGGSALNTTTAFLLGLLFKLSSLAVILFGFWIVSLLLTRLVRRVGKARELDDALTEFLARLVKSGWMIVGGITALGTIGVNVSALVGGLGLIGFAAGFAMKDVLSNVVAGVLILTYKPFTHHDIIRIKEMEGTVSFIDLRHTVLLADSGTVLVPNSMVLQNAVTVERKEPPSAGPEPPPHDSREH